MYCTLQYRSYPDNLKFDSVGNREFDPTLTLRALPIRGDMYPADSPLIIKAVQAGLQQVFRENLSFWLYQRVRQDIAQSPGFSWFGAVQRPSVKPTNLIAPGLKEQDDRLSVAYGISRLKMADLIHEVPALMTSIKPVDCAARYIEK